MDVTVYFSQIPADLNSCTYQKVLPPSEEHVKYYEDMMFIHVYLKLSHAHI